MPQGLSPATVFHREAVERADAEAAPETPTPFWTETIPLAGTGDHLAPGVGAIHGRRCASIAVRNLGSVDLIVNVGPPDVGGFFLGGGAAVITPGGIVVLQMPGTWHTFYGRPGELVEVTRYEDQQPSFAGQVGPGLWFPVDLGQVVTSSVAYTTPWGNRATYGGFTAREFGGTSPVAFRIRDGSLTGTVLDDVNLGAGGSTEEDTTMTTCVTPSLFVEFLGGGGSLRLTLRVR